MTTQLKIDLLLRKEVELISDALEACGSVSITLTDRYDTPILEPDIGTTPLWADVVIHAIFEEEIGADAAVANLRGMYPHVDIVKEILPEQEWERVCMADFKPQQFGQRLWVCPSWISPPEPEAINLILDPGLAFGTGTHPTTALCLTWLEQADLKGNRLIDYGCGSGVLALAALKLGARHVEAVDIDEQALIATRSNAAVNDIKPDALTVGFPDVISEPADVLIANILLSPLMSLKDTFYQLVKQEGLLVVSGILHEQKSQLIQDYQGVFEYQSCATQAEWGLVVFSRR